MITATSEKYRTSFGFTEEEVFASLGEYDLEETVKNALTQIEERRCGEVLAARGIAPQRIRCYGFAFRGKEVRIGEGSVKTEDLVTVT